ncbi:MAG: hypothetical protein Q4C01_00340 [Clostridia bacterium]|nr:hypothetical protein [Clostridia bacterium]
MYKTFKDFLGAIPINDIICRIQTEVHCSAPAAKELLDKFLNEVWRYIDGDSLEDKVLLSAISASTELQEKTKTLVRTDWESKNKSLLAKAQEELNTLNAELKSTTASLTEVRETLNRTKSEEERLADIIAEKEKLAENVEKAVAERIRKAQENAADFIANMAFVSGQQGNAAVAKVPVAAPYENAITTYHTYSAFEDLNDLDAHHCWADAINTAAFELGEAGVAEQYKGGLAAFLCAAYIEKQPILLIGPNATDIVQAFSAAISARKYGLLCCEGSFANHIITEIGANGEDIVIIKNLFSSSWMNRLPDILSHEDIFYLATHPFAEDIQVEPKSLYGFILPLFTEFFVDKKAVGKYYGGYFADDFSPYSPPKGCA